MDFFKDQPDFKGDPKHLEIILDAINKKDISIWNRWREANREIIPDLHGVYLSGNDFEEECLIDVNLSNTDLKYSVFNKTNLSNANLYKADLYSSDLSNANLHNSNCRGATISESSLIHTDLEEADLRESDLSGSVIMGTNLVKAQLNGVNVYNTQFINCKLAGVMCDYVYIDLQWQKRFPENRDFKEGELEEILKANREITQDLELSQ